MKSAVFVIAPEVFRDEEYAEPLAVLTAAGVDVTTASTRAGVCTGKLGMTAHATMTVAEALDADFDAVAFIGGAGAAVYFDDETAHALARRVLDRGGVVGAICIAPSALARAGLLDGVRATAFASQHDDLVAHGAVWTGEPVSVEGRIVTANGPEAATAFGHALLSLLESPLPESDERIER